MFNKISVLSFLLITIFTHFTFSASNVVIKYPSPKESIKTKWEWAIQQSDKFKKGVWMGYSINRLMPKNAIMGIYISGDDRFEHPTLEQIIYNRNINKINNESLSDVAKKALAHMDKKHDKKESEIIDKEIALLFYYKANPKNNEPDDFNISNISLYADLDNKPVIWLGVTSQDESANFLISKYEEMKDNEIKEDFMTAIGIHQQSEVPIDFLTSIIKSDEDNDIREDAVFWLGEHDNESSVEFIVNVANKDKSNDVREKAVFALYLMESEKAENALINLAKNSNKKNIKKKAIFWLGQKAAQKSAEVLEEIIEEDHDTEIKEQAVFALSQLDDNEGVPALIEIAKNHSNNEVRKKAIFWLSESGDKRALGVIIDLIKKKH